MLYLYFSDEEISVLQTSKSILGKEKIVASSRKQIPPEIIVDGIIKDQSLFIKEFTEVLATGYPTAVKEKAVALVISDKQVLTHRLTIPYIGPSDDASKLIIDEAKKVISLDIAQLVNFYKPLDVPAGSDVQNIFYTALSKAKILQLADFFAAIGMKLTFLASDSQVIHHLLAPIFNPGESWLYCNLNKSSAEYFVLDQNGLIKFDSEKLGTKSFTAKTKNILEHLEKEKITISKIIIGGSASIDFLLTDLDKEIKIPVVKMGEVFTSIMLKTQQEFDSGGIPQVLFASPFGLLTFSQTPSPANFASDLKNMKKEVIPQAVSSSEPLMTPPSVPTPPEEGKADVAVQPQVMPGQIVEYKKFGLGEIFANKIVLVILTLVIAVVVFFGVFFAVGKNSKISLPFMASPTLTPTPTSVPTLTPTPTIDTKLKRSDLKVSVQNGTDKAGYAKEIASYFEEKGYKNVAKSNADRDTYEKSIIKIKKAKENYLPLFISDSSGKFDTSTVETLEDSSSYDVVVILGKK